MSAGPQVDLDSSASGPLVGGRLSVTKGHGTHNDFVLVDDRDDEVDLAPGLVRGLADRRGGLGGDGVIRLVASALLPEGRAVLADHPDARWFMDYRNADGSTSQMCGNGVRVLAAFARRLGLWDGSGELALGTRAGVRRVRVVPADDDRTDHRTDQEVDDWYEVAMGPVTVGAGGAVGEVEVTVDGLHVARPGLGVDVGNPHVVVVLADRATLARADLSRPPAVEPAPVDGVNVELVVPLGEQPSDGGAVGRLAMRVHERGVGETRSCGTGACAAAAAVATWAGHGAPRVWLVEVPGGLLRVTLTADGGALLAGPATLVADAQVDLDALG